MFPAPQLLAQPLAEWRSLPPLQRTTGDDQPTRHLDEFRGSLSAHQDPRFLEPLGHYVVADAPGGSVEGLARPAPVQRTTFTSPRAAPRGPTTTAGPATVAATVEARVEARVQPSLQRAADVHATGPAEPPQEQVEFPAANPAPDPTDNGSAEDPPPVLATLGDPSLPSPSEVTSEAPSPELPAPTISASSQFEPQPSRPGTPQDRPGHSVQRATTGLPKLPSTQSVEPPTLDLHVVEMPAARSPQQRLPDVIPRPVPVALGATPASLAVQRAAQPVAAERLADPVADPGSDGASEASVSAPLVGDATSGVRRSDGAATDVGRCEPAGHPSGRKSGASRSRAAAVGSFGALDALGAVDAIGARSPNDRPTGYGRAATAGGPRDGADLASDALH